MDAMFQQCMQMMSQMNGMMGSGAIGSGMMGGMSANGMVALTSPWYWAGWIFVLALLVLLIAAVAWMIRATRRPRPAGGPETPLSILQRRLARGEVSPEQFETIKRQLA